MEDVPTIFYNFNNANRKKAKIMRKDMATET
jgi:hypothetical protein